MITKCPQCDEPHDLSECPRWRMPMHGTKSAITDDQVAASVRAFVNAGKRGADMMGAIRCAVEEVYAGAQPEQAKPTGLSKRLRDAVQELRRTPKPIADVIPMLQQAADEIERYYGGMLAWKATAEAKDRAAQQQPIAVQARELTDADIDKHLHAVLSASGSSLNNYSMQKTIDSMRAAMRTAMSHLTAPRGESDKTVGDGA